ncbi:MAG: AEC family transporter, partial [Pseudomonadota bacterium]
SNAAIVGLPLLHSLFGHKIVAFAAITNVVVLNLLFLVQVFMLESGQADGADDKKSTLQHPKNTLLNPIILSVILAIAFAITPFSLPKIVVTYMESLGAALTPCALFAVGMSIKLDDLQKSGAAMVFATCVKLLILPILVLVAARMIGVDALLTTVAVIIAAVPTATREFILARQYHVSEELVAGVISMTTALSVVTLIVWLLLLAQLYPGTFSFH